MEIERLCLPESHDADSLVQWASAALASADVVSPRLEAQLLLAMALGVTRSRVVAALTPPASTAQLADFERLVRERMRRIPLAYLRGSQEFYGLEFRVNAAVLVPRPETELLVECALEWLPEHAPAMLADAGVGSGCIAVAALANRQWAHGLGIDISAEALCIARVNAERVGVGSRIQFMRCDMLSGCASESIDVLVSNPPYIASRNLAGLQPEVRDWEPRAALDGGDDGLTIHRKVAYGARRALRRGGRVAIEVAMGQAGGVSALLESTGLAEIAIRKDLAGIERVVTARKA